MRSRFKKTLPVRRLIVTLLFICSASFFITNLAVTGAAGFDAVDLGLVISGVAFWLIAGVHSVYGHIKRMSQKPDEKPKEIIRPSTHSLINASLYSLSAVFFISGDAYNSTTPTLIRSVRLAGSSLWLISAMTYFIMAIVQERKQEDNPDVVVKPFGIHPSIFAFLSETEYYVAGMLYAIAIYCSDPIPIWKAAGNGCWLTASTHEFFRTLFDVINRNKPPENVENERVVDVTEVAENLAATLSRQ